MATNFYQLKLLLWKNFLIKRRLPLILFLETVIPLILFVILGLIRHYNPPLITYTQNAPAKALPSTGLISMMQALCSGSPDFPWDGDGLPNLTENSTLYRWLLRVDHVYRDFRVLYPNSSLALLDRMPSDYQKSLDHLAVMHPVLEELQYLNYSDYGDVDRLLESSLLEQGNFSQLLKQANISSEEIIARLNDNKQLSFHESVYLLTQLAITGHTNNGQYQLPVPRNLSGLASGHPPAVSRQELVDLLFPLQNGPISSHLSSANSKLLPIHRHLLNYTANGANFSSSSALFNLSSSNASSLALASSSLARRYGVDPEKFIIVDSNSSTFIFNETAVKDVRNRLATKFNISDETSRVLTDQLADILSDFAEFTKFHKTLEELAKIVVHLPLDACHTTDDGGDWNVTIPRRNNSSKSSESQSDFGGFFTIYNSLKPVICPSNGFMDNTTKERNASSFYTEGGAMQYGRDIAQYVPVWGKLLKSNPKVLFTPGNSSASLVMKKANRTFEFIDQLTAFARHWLANTTVDLHRYFSRPETNNKLTVLRMTQRHLELALQQKRNLTTTVSPYELALAPFLEIPIKNATEILAQLDLIDRAACSWVELVSTANLSFFMPFGKENDAVEYSLYKAHQDNITVLAIIAFDVNNSDGSLLQHTSYKIRMNSSFLPSVRKIRPIYWSPIPRNWDYYYYFSGFSFLQDIVDRAIIDVLVGREVIEPGTYATNVPMPCYLYDTFLFTNSVVLPLCMTISFVYTAAILVQNIVSEKEHRLKEFMKVMGLSNTVHGVAWFITAFVQLTFSMTIVTLLLRYSKVLLHSNPFIIWIILELYAVATITFSFLISSLFSKAKIASATAGMLYFLSYVPAMCIGIREDITGGDIPSFFKKAASLLSTSAFGLSCKYISLRESEGAGVQWNNVAISPIEHDSFSLVHAFVFLAFDSIIYLLLAVYIENVHPGSYGIPKPWYYPFTKIYWTGLPGDDSYDEPGVVAFFSRWYKKLMNKYRSSNDLSIIEDDQLRIIAEMENNNFGDGKNFEQDPTGLLLGVEIDKLTKLYQKTGKMAVNRLSLKLYESQITGLLGHNGAGKTSTMSILTGILPPTSGSVRIYGLDMAKNLDVIRSSVGYCPQHNVLFEQLTPEEHLQFYSGLKRISKHDASVNCVEQMLKDVGLTAKSSTPVNHLSGGMKRKLSIALAFVGRSRLVILDEPTAGVDPYSRRAIWDLIVKYKAGRTILLSTHHMDEADVLSDRIAIISNGRLKCCGTSIFLRNTFCDGYHLVCVKNNSIRRPVGSSSDEVAAFMKKSLASAYLYSESKHELHFILPYVEERQGNFGAFFKELNANLKELGLLTYGVYDSTLEEAFLHITRTAQCEEGATFVHRGHRRQSSDASAASVRGVSSSTNNRRRQQGRSDDDVPLVSRSATGHGHSRQSSDVSSDIVNVPAAAPARTRHGHTRQSSADSILLNSVDKTPMPDASKPQQFDATSLLSAADVFTVLGGGNGHHHQRLDEGLSSHPSRFNHRFIHLKHFKALIIKRLLYVRRNWKVLFSQVFLPAIFVSIAMSMALSAPMFDDPDPLDLSPAQFLNATKPRGLYTPISNLALNPGHSASAGIRDYDGWMDATSTEIANSFHLISGMSATCTLSSNSKIELNELHSTSTSMNMAKYFESQCYGSFTEGVALANFSLHCVSSQLRNDSLYYPICQCALDYSGFVCPLEYVRPPTFQLVTGDFIVDIGSQNMTQYLLYTSDEYRRHRYGAMAFGNELSHVPVGFGEGAASAARRMAVRRVNNYYFEHRGFHTLPAYLNAVNNAILRANIQKVPKMGNPAAYGITTYNHPINGTDKVLDQDLAVQGTDMMIAVFIIIAMSFVPASFVVFLVYERSLLVKHAHMMAGLHPVMYWLTSYIWDLFNYFVPAACCIVILTIFNVPAYVAGYNLPAIVLLFLLYGWSMTPMMYPTSFYFNDPSKAYVILVVFNLFIGTTCLITSFLLDMFHFTPVLKTVDEIVKIAFLVFPSYCLGRGIMDVAINHYRNEFYTLSGQYEEIASPFTWETTLRNYVVMAVEGFLFFGITIVLEVLSRQEFFAFASNGKKRRSWIPPSMRDSENDDPDVIAERHRVLSGATSGDLLVIDGLTKQYSTRGGPLLAVDRLSLGLPPGECFGLLGLNGAGKSTTFSMLSGIFSATAGEARLASSVLCGSGKPTPDILRSVGYCPQTDPLLEELTAREHLQLYARIRGINSKLEASIVSWLLERMGLELYADKPSRTFSGGTKRKLSAALALLGDPRIVLLDEPTTGMDPGSRRFLWNLILELRSENRLVVLTSHSMEECEVLCSRLAVMVSGRLRCLGSTQQLKDKFGNGYLVTVRLPASPARVGNRFSSNNGNSNNNSPNQSNQSPYEMLAQSFDRAGMPSSSWRFVAQRHQIIELALLSAKPDLSIIFAMLNELRLAQKIADFSVSQNTLDSVFLQLAHGSQPAANVADGSNSTRRPSATTPNGNSNNVSIVDPATVVWADDEPIEERDDELLIR